MKKIAVVGVSESIGREILAFLADGGYKPTDVAALENKAPLGTQVSFGEDDDIDVGSLENFDFAEAEIAIFAVSEEITRRYAAKAAKSCKVIDCSGAFFADAEVPMVVAGVNDEQMTTAVKNIVGVPSAAVTQILLPLKAVDEACAIKRLVVSTYTSTSVYGKEGMDELFNQTRKIFMNDSLVDSQQVFGKQIAFNVIPQVEEFIGEETKLEWQINAETKKVLGRDVKVHANCAFIPAFIGNAVYVNAECDKEVDVEEVRKLMKQTEGVIVFDKNVKGGYVTLNDVQGEIEVYVSRLRQDVSVGNGFSFWSAADNLRFGVAGNAYKIMQNWLGKN